MNDDAAWFRDNPGRQLRLRARAAEDEGHADLVLVGRGRSGPVRVPLDMLPVVTPTAAIAAVEADQAGDEAVRDFLGEEAPQALERLAALLGADR